MGLPEFWVGAKDAHEQVARVIGAFGEWIFVQAFESDGDEVFQTDVLADGDSQIFDVEVAQWKATETVDFGDEVGIVGWFAPVLTIELLE